MSSKTRERAVAAPRQWLLERGWVTETANHGRREVLVAQRGDERKVIRVSSKAAGTSQVSGRDHGTLGKGDRHWAIVGVSKPVAKVVILPEDRVRIRPAAEHAAYVAKHGGPRPGNARSTHQALTRATMDELRTPDASEWRRA